jgi:hypothetical protein
LLNNDFNAFDLAWRKRSNKLGLVGLGDDRAEGMSAVAHLLSGVSNARQLLAAKRRRRRQAMEASAQSSDRDQPAHHALSGDAAFEYIKH